MLATAAPTISRETTMGSKPPIFNTFTGPPGPPGTPRAPGAPRGPGAPGGRPLAMPVVVLNPAAAMLAPKPVPPCPRGER